MANLTTFSHHGDNASAAAASSSTACSSASTFCSDFEVFINHRGPDVKHTFASHLYHRLHERGLRVFFDKSEMEEGHNIWSQIKDAIRVASVHVAILSPRYAESNWCLNELVLMKKSGSTILPVFYKVQPSELRWAVEDGAYAKALRHLEQKTTHDPETGEEKPRYGPDTIQEWRNALFYVSNLSGFVLSGDTNDKGKILENVVEQDEGELLDRLVQSVLQNVPKPPLDVAKYPTGLNLKLEEFEKTVLSQQELDLLEAKVVGIVGAGGVGKTTLAKEFFNLRRSQYNSSSFLFDMRENAGTKSLAYLHNKLLEDLTQIKNKYIEIESRDEGIGILKRKLSSRHVLIVLDDIDHMEQLEAVLPIKKILRPGSLILVTSRDKNLLTASGVLESSIYIMKGMTTPHSKELFCSYAFQFHEPNPLQEFADLVDRFVKACDGLPLSLKVFGALVSRENERSAWLEILDELDNIMPIEIHDRLRISCNSLSSKVKEIFLDIACFFLGEDGDKAIRIWGKREVQILQNKCLMELDKENKIKMHDHIRDMGRKIADEGSMPRRLCYQMTNFNDDLFQQLSPVGTEVRGIKMLTSPFDLFLDFNASSWQYYYVLRSLKFSPYNSLEMRHPLAMRNLRLVSTDLSNLEGILSRVQSPHLIWLRWYGCSHTSLPHWIPMQNLRVLEVGGWRLNTLWPHSQAAPSDLRELNICAPLSDIPKSIRELKNLERIVISHSGIGVSSTLKRLPDEFCHLRSLKYLVFKRFSRMVSLPGSFGELINLEHVDLDGATSLQMLPHSFGNLSRLKYLCLSRCEKLTISNGTLRDISMLEYLDLSSCKQLKELPPQVSHQRSLQTLYLRGTKLKELPSLIGDLCNLEVLKLGSNFLEVLPLRFGDIKNLKILSISSSPQLKSLPDSIGLLTQLTRLSIRNCGIEYLPQQLLKMNSLEFLKVSGCPLRGHPFKKEVEGERKPLSSLERERELNKLSSNNRCMFGLKELVLSTQTEREIFSDEGVCPNLQKLTLRSCYELRQIGGLCTLPKLRDLTISSCTKVEELPGLETLISLESLAFDGCEKLQSIPGLGQLTKLRRLTVDGCREIPELPGVEHLTSLEELYLEDCEKLQTIPVLGQLTKLRKLTVGECREIPELPGVEHLSSLEELFLYSCEKLQSIPVLGQLTKLRKLIVFGWREIPELLGVEHLSSLEKLLLYGCEKLQSIQGLQNLTKIRELDVIECRGIAELPGLEHLTSLEKLNVSGLEKLKSIQGLQNLTKIRKLDVSECRGIAELPGLEHLTSLQKLNLSGLEKLKSIRGLGRQHTKIKELNVCECWDLEELAGVEYLMSLEILNACKCPKLQWSEGVVEQLRQELNDGFRYDKERKRRSCLQFLRVFSA